jgi:hypothetical protein
MNRTINRLKLLFLGIFSLASVIILIWQVGWVRPREACEEAHRWWDNGQRICAQPILTSDITGRMITDPQARAEAMKAVGRPAGATPERKAP